MVVRVPEVEAAALVTVVDLAVVVGLRAAAERHALVLDPLEDRVELLVGGQERVVVAVDLPPVVEVHRERVVELHRGEGPPRALVLQAEDARDELRRRLFVVGRDDRVVEIECHDALL